MLGSLGNTLFCIGAIVGYAIIVPAIIITNLLGGNTPVLEIVINSVGCILFISVGGMSIANTNNSIYQGKLQNMKAFSLTQTSSRMTFLHHCFVFRQLCDGSGCPLSSDWTFVSHRSGLHIEEDLNR